MNAPHASGCALFVAGLISLSSTAQAQVTLLEEGDMIGTIGVLSRIDDVAINNNADWVVRADTDAASTEDEVIIHNGNIVFQQGATTGIPSPAGTTFNFLDAAVLTDNGDVLYLFNANLPAGGTGSLLYRNGALLLEQGVTSVSGAGTPLWFVDDDHTVAGGSTANDSWIYRGTMPLWREGDPMPSHPGSAYGTMSSLELDMNDAGDYVYQSGRDGSFTMDVLVVNDTTIIAEEGGAVPGVPGGFVLTTIGSTSSVFITDNQDVLWFGDWDDPNTDVDSAIFLNQAPLIQEGVSTINGNVIHTIAATDKGFALSDNGRWLIVEFFSITAADPT